LFLAFVCLFVDTGVFGHPVAGVLVLPLLAYGEFFSQLTSDNTFFEPVRSSLASLSTGTGLLVVASGSLLTNSVPVLVHTQFHLPVPWLTIALSDNTLLFATAGVAGYILVTHAVTHDPPDSTTTYGPGDSWEQQHL